MSQNNIVGHSGQSPTIKRQKTNRSTDESGLGVNDRKVFEPFSINQGQKETFNPTPQVNDHQSSSLDDSITRPLTMVEARIKALQAENYELKQTQSEAMKKIHELRAQFMHLFNHTLSQSLMQPPQ